MSNASQSGSWSAFLKSITSFNGDLSTLTAPPFILSPTSLSEYSKYWAEYPQLLIEPSLITLSEGADNSERDAMAAKRMIAVTKWFISTLRSQYCSRSESMGTEKKPLNPFLGEVFVGKWDDPSSDGKVGETVLLSEQVSHHPPVTAYAIYNEKNDTVLQGYNRIKATMSTAFINVKQYGHAILEYKGLNESYLITLPPLHIEGLITASPFVELEGTSYIQSSSGYIAVVDFSGRGYFSGKKNSFKARIYKSKLDSAHKENAIASISGQWSKSSYIAPGSKSPSSKEDELFYDASAQHCELQVKPIEKQHPIESRRAWQKVAEAIKKVDYNLIAQEKSLIENEQRELRKKEDDAGIKWENRWFDEVDYLLSDIHDPFINLTNLASLSIHNAPSGSVKKSKYDSGDANHWRVNFDKWKAESEITI
ncbi:uncharacterized protein PRCAT00004149001 [Priceomyces carsonii]|uniref:uncharacterized protein n=1 Tax=Priceomyces carsonii TaxID=28549 RepID=UPI002ED7CA33|nr:unnamed protein product [Priceomyces carsonii]